MSGETGNQPTGRLQDEISLRAMIALMLQVVKPLYEHYRQLQANGNKAAADLLIDRFHACIKDGVVKWRLDLDQHDPDYAVIAAIEQVFEAGVAGR